MSDTTKRFLAGAIAVALMTVCSPASAESYEVTVTRKGKNLYRVSEKKILIQTRYCYVYAYAEEAILKLAGRGDELIFLDSKEKCDVRAVFSSADPKPGKYSVRVTREEDDWYEVEGVNIFAKTSGCLSLALGEDAILSVDSSGFGRLTFEDGEACDVEALYSRMKM